MSGYTGFVPRTRPIIGTGYPIKVSPHLMLNWHFTDLFLFLFVTKVFPYFEMENPSVPMTQTHVGLNTFTDATRAHDALRGTAVTNLSPKEVVMATTRPIYPQEAGMIPNYTGHVPGYKFQFGHTYGQGTVAATPGKFVFTVISHSPTMTP